MIKSFIAIIVLFCIFSFIIIILYSLSLPRAKNPDSSPTMDNPSEKAVDKPIKNRRDFVYPKYNLRDPFKSQNKVPKNAETPTRHEPSITLTGIIWKPEKPLAIIIGSEDKSYIVKPGDVVGKTRILAIYQKSILVEKDGKRQEMLIWEENSKP